MFYRGLPSWTRPRCVALNRSPMITCILKLHRPCD
uniref:Uncharacterized protein n=1 Tax=Anguilla anguilla TaxID=7936 RepID=A0A0E9WAQ5_ANGAN